MSYGSKLVTISKKLRVMQTPWEAKLWYYLRANRMIGLKFKRQVMIGDYIVDFSCEEKKLAIELDGSQHNSEGVDKAKTTHLKSQGYFVLRFWNNELDTNLDGVLETIRETATSLPASPHAWGEE